MPSSVECETSLSDCRPIKLSHLEKLQEKKKDLEVRLADINNAIELLEKNPEVKGVLDALSKVFNRL